MSAKKAKPDEFEAMAKMYEILKPFDEKSRPRIYGSVMDKLCAEAPKKRVRKAKQQSNLMNGLPVVEVGLQ